MYFNSKIKKSLKSPTTNLVLIKRKQHCERRITVFCFFRGEFNLNLRAKAVDFAALTELLSLAATAALWLYFANFSNTAH